MAIKDIRIKVKVEKESSLGKLVQLHELAERMERITSDVLYELSGEIEKAAEPMEGSAAE